MSLLYPELYPQIFAALDMVTAISMRLVCRDFAQLPLPADPELKARNKVLCHLPTKATRTYYRNKKKNSSLSFLSLTKACCLMGYTELFQETSKSFGHLSARPGGPGPIFTERLIDYTDAQQEEELNDYYNAAVIGGSEQIFSYLEASLSRKPTKECIYLCAKYQRREIAKRILKQPVPKDVALRSRTIAIPDADWLPRCYREIRNGDKNTLQYAIKERNYALIPNLITEKNVTWFHVLQAKYMLHSSCEQAKTTYQLLLKAATRKGHSCGLETILALDDLDLYKSEANAWKLEFIPQQAIANEAYSILFYIFDQAISKQTTLLEQLQLLKDNNYTLKDRSLIAHVIYQGDLNALRFLTQELRFFPNEPRYYILLECVKKFSFPLLDFLHEYMPTLFDQTIVEKILKKDAQVFLEWVEQRLKRQESFCAGLSESLTFYAPGKFSLHHGFTSVICQHDLVACLPYIFITAKDLIENNALRCLRYMFQTRPTLFKRGLTYNPDKVQPRIKQELAKYL